MIPSRALASIFACLALATAGVADPLVVSSIKIETSVFNPLTGGSDFDSSNLELASTLGVKASLLSSTDDISARATGSALEADEGLALTLKTTLDYTSNVGNFAYSWGLMHVTFTIDREYTYTFSGNSSFTDTRSDFLARIFDFGSFLHPYHEFKINFGTGSQVLDGTSTQGTGSGTITGLLGPGTYQAYFYNQIVNDTSELPTGDGSSTAFFSFDLTPTTVPDNGTTALLVSVGLIPLVILARRRR
jgi:hypothetical protein